MASEFDGQVQELCRGCDQVIDRSDLARILGKRKSLRVKAGFDPTAPDLHFGHLVLLNKLRQFQSFGHRVVFLIGDYTGRIGDPSGRNTTRPQLDDADIERNAQSYREQVFKVLDESLTEITYNSSWCGKLDGVGLIRLMQRVSLARIIERDDFAQRLRARQSIRLHELLYPLIQAYDSVQLRPDIELGGSDQLFNLLLGRTLMEGYGHEPQMVMTLPLLEGLDGTQKMSKSLDNYIAFNDSAPDMYGKIMSLSDDLMWRYYDLIGPFSGEEIAQMRAAAQAGENPMAFKQRLADALVAQFHGPQAAERASADFKRRFSERRLPEDLPELLLERARPEEYRLAVVLRDAGLVPSSSEAMRQIRQKAVRVNESRVGDVNAVLDADRDYILQVGRRRVARVRLKQG